MMDSSLDQRIMDYLDGKLSTEDEAALFESMKKAGRVSELDDLKEVVKGLESMVQPEPGPGLNRKFYHMLGEYMRREEGSFFNRLTEWTADRRVKRLAYQFAGAAALLIIGWSAGRFVNPAQDGLVAMTAEVRQMKKMMTFSMLNQESPLERIRAIHYMKSLTGNKEVVNALIETLNSDENVNVRLVALETLLDAPRTEPVKNGLIHAVFYQNSPLMQLTLVNALLEENNEEVFEALRLLMSRKSLHYKVRERIESAVTSLI